MRFRRYQSTVLPANWKVVVDAFNEAYHVQGTHPQILPWTDDVSIAYEQLGIHAHYGRLPEARRELKPSPRLGLGPGDYDEGEILAGLVGWSRSTVPRGGDGDRRRAARATTVARPEPDRRVPGAQAPAVVLARGRRVGAVARPDDERGRRVRLPERRRTDLSRFGHRVPRPAERPRSRLEHQGHLDARVASTRSAAAQVGAALLPRRGRTRTGARSPTRTTPTCSRCRPG